MIAKRAGKVLRICNLRLERVSGLKLGSYQEHLQGPVGTCSRGGVRNETSQSSQSSSLDSSLGLLQSSHTWQSLHLKNYLNIILHEILKIFPGLCAISWWHGDILHCAPVCLDTDQAKDLEINLDRIGAVRLEYVLHMMRRLPNKQKVKPPSETQACL